MGLFILFIYLACRYWIIALNHTSFFAYDRRGPVRYRFQGLYELDSLAVVNVRDAGPNKNAFKILMFPDSKMYQADSSKSKVHRMFLLSLVNRYMDM